MVKALNYLLDFLMFVVPILELSEAMTLIPVAYLPWYMISVVVLRRVARLLEEKLNAKKDT